MQLSLKRLAPKAFVYTLFLLGVESAFAQSAKEFLKTSLTAYGSWEKVQSFQYATDRSNLNPWQSYSYTNPKIANHQWEATVDFANGTYRSRSTFNYPGGYVFDFVNIGKDSTRWFYDYNKTRNGKILVKQGKDGYNAQKASALQSFPFYTVKALAETNDSLAYNQKASEVVIKRLLKNGSAIDYVFDAQT